MTQVETNRIKPEHALDYLLGGNAMIILHSTLSGAQYRFKVWRKEDADDPLWYVYDPVHTLDGKDRYMGFIRKDTRVGLYYKQADGIFISKECSAGMQAFQWTILHLIDRKPIPKELHLLHTGSCSVCSRPLTDAESLEWGIGPICRQKLGL
jgi:hypothetical protein